MFQLAHQDWINAELLNEPGLRANGRQDINEDDKYVLKEPSVSYSIGFDIKTQGLNQ